MSMEANDQVATGETAMYEEPTNKAPNKLARVVMVVGIIAIVVGINYVTSIRPPIIKEGGGGEKPINLPKLPYAAKEIVASKWLNTKDGKPIKLAELKGKIVLLEFWRFECHSCEAAIPMMQDLERKFAQDDVHIVTIHSAVTESEKDEQALRNYLKAHNLKLPVAMDNDKTTLEKKYGYPVTTPTFLLINKKGNVIDYEASVNAQTALEIEIRALLNGSDLEKEAKAKNVGATSSPPATGPMPIAPGQSLPGLPGQPNTPPAPPPAPPLTPR